MAVSSEVARYRQLFGEVVSQEVAVAYFARVEANMQRVLQQGWNEVAEELSKPENEKALYKLVDNCSKKK